MTSTRSLRPARSSADSRNPNAGGRRAAPASRRDRPRLTDRVNAPRDVTVLYVNPATLRRRLRAGDTLRPTTDVRHVAGIRPVSRKRRAVWTADRLFDLAARAERNGHERRAAALLDLAIQACETAQSVLATS